MQNAAIAWNIDIWRYPTSKWWWWDVDDDDNGEHGDDDNDNDNYVYDNVKAN